MPSVDRIKQLSVGGVTAVLLAVGASSASAAPNQVWLWACHAPSDQIGQTQSVATAFTSTQNGGTVGSYGDGCAGTGGIELKLNKMVANPNNPSADPTKIGGLSEARALFHALPSDTVMTQVRLTRSFVNFGQTSASNALVYNASGSAQNSAFDTIRVNQTPVDRSPFTITSTNTHDALALSLKCNSGGPNDHCTADNDPAVRLFSAGVQVEESKAGGEAELVPKMAVGGVRNEMDNTVNLEVKATDNGTGLAYAIASLDGATVRRDFAGGTNCRDLTPSTPNMIDMPMDAVCPTVDTVTLPLDTTQVTDGAHTLSVKTYDWSGRVSELTQAVNVNNHPNLGQSSQTLNIGTSAIPGQQGSGGSTGGSGGVAGATSTACRSPRLSVILAQKPLRVSKGRPVLRYKKRYRFTGRLTCVINGKRRSAPKRARIDLLNTIGKKTTLDKSGTTVHAKGAFTIIVAYRSSRLLTFRFTNSAGQRSQVRIRIIVQKKKKSKR